jgi:heterotetrameric sarcosine oxidase gamma subunit
VAPDAIPYPFEFQLLEEDWDHFEVLMTNALLRIPALEVTGIKKFYNGPESFTPDNQFILGEAPEVSNFFVGAGFNSVGIATAGGAGRALAEWIVNGAATSDLTGVDIRRFAPFNGNNGWLRDRVAEVLGIHYEIPWPNREMTTARPFRRSPVHHVLAAAGANFGSKMGWERANFFAPEGAEPVIEYTWGTPNWLRWSAAEQSNTRTNVTVFDQTSFSKYLLVGRDAESVLQWVCTADVGVEVGRSVYTGMLNERGTYEADVTVTRTGPTEFLIISSAATTERDKDHIRKHVPDGADAALVDMTSAYAVFGVMGPKSRALLSTLTSSDLSDDAFPFATSRQISLGYATVRATRITYVGELGWEFYVPVEFAVGVYEDLMTAGAQFGVSRGGYYAIESLRLEKGYRAFGRELTPSESPLEAGLLFACKLNTDITFLGREALEKAVETAKAEGPQRKLVGFKVDSPEAMLWGGELVLRDGAVAGQVTSAAWGETTGACVGLAYVKSTDGSVVNADWVKAGSYEVNVGGQRYPVSVSLRPLYDPTNARIRPGPDHLNS